MEYFFTLFIILAIVIGGVQYTKHYYKYDSDRASKCFAQTQDKRCWDIGTETTNERK